MEEGKNDRNHALDGIPKDLPALLLARKAISILKKEAMVSEGIPEHVKRMKEDLDRLETCESPGDMISEVLFSLSEVAQDLGVDAECVLRKKVLALFQDR
jgi:hypothetical protein